MPSDHRYPGMGQYTLERLRTIIRTSVLQVGYKTLNESTTTINSPQAEKVKANMSQRRRSKLDSNAAPLESNSRAELLLQLGDKHSMYCIECHNIRKHSIGQAVRPIFNLKPQCAFLQDNTKVVDICPCSAMSLHSTRNCMVIARTPEKQHFYQKYWRINDPSLGCETGNMEFTHECTFAEHSLATVRIKTRVWFDEGSRSLQVQNLLNFDASVLRPAQIKNLSISESNKCVHHDAKEWLHSFFQESKARVDMKILESDYCEWLGWEESKSDESPRAFAMVLHRNLGSAHWPDKRWMRYSHTQLRPPRHENRYFLKGSHLR